MEVTESVINNAEVERQRFSHELCTSEYSRRLNQKISQNHPFNMIFSARSPNRQAQEVSESESCPDIEEATCYNLTRRTYETKYVSELYADGWPTTQNKY